MREFDPPDDQPQLSMDLPPAAFEARVQEIADGLPDDLAHGIYGECLDEEVSGLPQAEVSLKRGALLKLMGGIEYKRGDYDDALASYRRALTELSDVNEIASLELFTAEAHLLMHEFNDPAAAIEPYEASVRIYEANFAAPSRPVPPHAKFNSYTSVLGHLAAGYQITGDEEKSRQTSKKSATFGDLSPAVFGFEECSHIGTGPDPQDPAGHIHQNIRTALSHAPASPSERQQKARDLEDLLASVDREDFLADMPEQRKFVLQAIYARYGTLIADKKEQAAYYNRAIRLAKKHNFLVPLVDNYMVLAKNQAGSHEPMDRQAWTVKKAFEASLHCLDAGASIEAALVDRVLNSLVPLCMAMKDAVGMGRAKRELASRGIKITTTLPISISMN